MVLVVVWLLYHLTLKSAPSVNCVWDIAFVNHFHVWVRKFKPSLMFLQLLELTSNNVVWVSFFAFLFDKTQYVVKISTTEYVPDCYEIVNLLFFFLQGLSMLFIEPQNLLLMGLTFFFICVNSRVWTRFVTSLVFIACNLSVNCSQICENIVLQQYFLKAFALGC